MKHYNEYGYGDKDKKYIVKLLHECQTEHHIRMLELQSLMKATEFVDFVSSYDRRVEEELVKVREARKQIHEAWKIPDAV